MTKLALSEVLSRAISAYRAGNLAEAEQLCGRMVCARQDFFEALHLLAIVQWKLGRQEEALASYDRAIACRPDDAEARYNRAVVLTKLKRCDEALADYDRALVMRPRHAATFNNRGVALTQMKRYDEALADYDRALALREDYAEAFSNRGNVLRKLKRYDEALADYDRALALRPRYAMALSNRGVVLKELKRHEEALACYDRALTLRPDYVDAHCNRGNVLKELNRCEEALASYERALVLRPDHADTHYNRGASLYQLKRYDEALASYERSLALRPDHADTHYNRGVTLVELRRFDEALASYGHAIALQPDHAEARFNRATCPLLIADFDRGWKSYESRWDIGSGKSGRRGFAQPLWLGEADIAGKTILLHAEQGLGDSLQFCRYAPLVSARGARVILEVPDSLCGLMGTLAGVHEIVATGQPLPYFDFHCPLLSLPLAFGTRLESIPSTTPYLHAPLQSASGGDATWESRHHPRIGLAWSGNPAHKNDRNRSIPLSLLRPLFGIDATFVSLQKDVRAEDATAFKACGLSHCGDALKDFSHTAAIMTRLDLIISVDTSIAHLAGALARPVWVLLPFIPDWRWLLDRDDSPWYPTARLFRQDAERSWSSVIARVQAALGEFLADLRPGA